MSSPIHRQHKARWWSTCGPTVYSNPCITYKSYFSWNTLLSTKDIYGKWCLRSEASEMTSLPFCHWVGMAWLCGANGVCKMRVYYRHWVVLPPLQSEERLQMRLFLGGEEGECTLAYKKFILRLRKRFPVYCFRLYIWCQNCSQARNKDCWNADSPVSGVVTTWIKTRLTLVGNALGQWCFLLLVGYLADLPAAWQLVPPGESDTRIERIWLVWMKLRQRCAAGAAVAAAGGRRHRA